MDSEDFYEKVKSDFQEAIALDIKQTPTTVVRHNPTGKQVILAGAVSPEEVLKTMTQIVQGSGANN